MEATPAVDNETEAADQTAPWRLITAERTTCGDRPTGEHRCATPIAIVVLEARPDHGERPA